MKKWLMMVAIGESLIGLVGCSSVKEQKQTEIKQEEKAEIKNPPNVITDYANQRK